MDLNARRRVRRESITTRVRRVADLIAAEPHQQWIVWCDLNDEASMVTAMVPHAVEVRGADDPERKADVFTDFARGRIRVLVTKPRIAAYGLNWQSCARVAFCGLSDSFEAFYQAIRRCWRYGQTRPVNVYVVASDADKAVVANITRKQLSHKTMIMEMTNEE